MTDECFRQGQGCGKSALYRELERRLLESGQAKTFERIDDFPQIWAKFMEDDARDKEGKERLYSRPTADGDYLVTNEALFDDILEQVNEDLLRIDRPEHMVFVEFARPNYVRAFRYFDQAILANSLAICMQVTFETCWARNLARHQAAVAAGGDDHLVSREEMEKTFLHDDRDALVQHMADRSIPVRVLDNEADGTEHLEAQVAELRRDLF